MKQELTLRNENIYIMEVMTCFTHFAYFVLFEKCIYSKTSLLQGI
jgi:hypothetical protein